MTLRYLYNGVEQTNTSTRIKGPIGSITSRADGQVASGEAIIKDPLGILDYRMLRSFRVVEDACVAAPILHHGMIYNLKVSRGDYVTGPAREWSFQFTDLNGLLHERVLYDKHAKRKRESGNARLAWLLASRAMSGLVYDNGEIGNLTDPYDESDFRGQFADDVLQSVMASSVMDEAKLFFVYMDQPSGQPSLFLHSPTATIGTSTLRVSNVPGDYDGVTTFRPLPGPEAELSGEDIYDGVYFTTKNGSIFRQRPATFTDYPRHRDGTFSTERISLGTTAERHAQLWLAYHAGRRDTVTCQIRLPRDKVGLIQAGDRIQVRFAHLPGYEDWVWSRITARTFPVNEGYISHYDVQLELSTVGLFPAGGVGTGGVASYPKQTTPPGVVQKISGPPVATGVDQGTLTLPTGPPAEGNLLVAYVISRGTSIVIDATHTWTEHPHGQISPGSDYARMFWRLAGAGESAKVRIVTGGGTWAHIWELASVDGTVVASSFQDVDTGGAIPATMDWGALAGAGLGIGGLCVHCSDSSSGGWSRFGDPPGWTHDAKYEIYPPADTTEPDTAGEPHPAGGAWHTQNPSGVAPVPWMHESPYNFAGWGGLGVVFASVAADDPPLSGQWVRNVVPTPPADGVTTTFTLPNGDGYVEKSVTVKVDGVPILNGLTETDPQNGVFTLDFAPLGAVGDTRAEIITVDYQSI